MPFSQYAIHLAINEMANRTIQLRIHTANPHAGNGTTHRIAGASVDVAAAGWTNATSGVVENVADAVFGVLSNSSSITVTHVSLWDGANYMGAVALTNSVAVAANESFKINARTIDLMGAAV